MAEQSLDELLATVTAGSPSTPGVAALLRLIAAAVQAPADIAAALERRAVQIDPAVSSLNAMLSVLLADIGIDEQRDTAALLRVLAAGLLAPLTTAAALERAAATLEGGAHG